MAALIVPFVPRAHLDAAGNVAEFTRAARYELTVFGADLLWTQHIWDISDVVAYAGKKNAVRLYFEGNDGQPLQPPWADFARGYLRYQFGLSPRTGITRKLMAIRAPVETVEREVTCVSELMVDDFERACGWAMQKYSGGTAYNLGKDLAEMFGLLSRMQMLAMPGQWRNPIPRPANASGDIRVGRKFEEARKKRMPEESALEAIPRLFRSVAEPGDILLTSILALLQCAPMRISELLALPVDCEHEEVVNGQTMYGLRWWPRKGAPPQIKWIPGVMVEVAREAIARVRDLTAHGRRLASWYAQSSQIWLPDDQQHLRGTAVSIEELSAALGYAAATLGNKIAQMKLGSRSRASGFLFDEVAPKLLPPLPRNFPMLDQASGLTYDRALFAVPHEFGDLQHGHRNWPSAIDQGWVERRVAPPDERPGFFERHGVVDSNGNPVRITSHQFRHWLNTLAKRGGLGDLDLARWSGRANIHQNRTYDHRSASEIHEAVRAVRTRNYAALGIPDTIDAISVRLPIDREQFLEAKYPAAHTTDLGACVHDFSLLPCQLHGDCVRCNEHEVIKGHPKQLQAAQRRLAEAEQLLAAAIQGVADGDYGADRWEERQRAVVDRLRAMIAIHEDAAIPDGQLVELAPMPADSEIHHAVRRRQRHR